MTKDTIWLIIIAIISLIWLININQTDSSQFSDTEYYIQALSMAHKQVEQPQNYDFIPLKGDSVLRVDDCVYVRIMINHLTYNNGLDKYLFMVKWYKSGNEYKLDNSFTKYYKFN